MPQGIQVWDSAGKKLLDSSLQTSSFLGTVDITSVGVITINDLRFAWGAPFFLSDSMYSGSTLKGEFVGTTLTLTVSTSAGGVVTFKPLKVYYGVF